MYVHKEGGCWSSVRVQTHGCYRRSMPQKSLLQSHLTCMPPLWLKEVRMAVLGSL